MLTLAERLEPVVLADGLVFGEAPRWHDGKLWFSDIHGKRVMTCDERGQLETIVEGGKRWFTGGWGPCGLGFLPDGTPLVVAMSERLLYRIEGDRVEKYADLSGAIPYGRANDMVVDASGRAYVGGVDSGTIAVVHPDGSVATAEGSFPSANGMVLADDGRTLIVVAARRYLMAVSRREDGMLDVARAWADLSVEGAAQRRAFAGDLDRPMTWAELLEPVGFPDGIAIDAEGAIWVACLGYSKFMRVLEGGHVTDVVPTPGRLAVACALGGADGRTLFMVTARTTIGGLFHGASSSAIEIATVPVPSAA